MLVAVVAAAARPPRPPLGGGSDGRRLLGRVELGSGGWRWLLPACVASSGTGGSSQVKYLAQHFPDRHPNTVSHTTRSNRGQPASMLRLVVCRVERCAPHQMQSNAYSETTPRGLIETIRALVPPCIRLEPRTAFEAVLPFDPQRSSNPWYK